MNDHGQQAKSELTSSDVAQHPSTLIKQESEDEEHASQLISALPTQCNPMSPTFDSVPSQHEQQVAPRGSASHVTPDVIRRAFVAARNTADAFYQNLEEEIIDIDSNPPGVQPTEEHPQATPNRTKSQKRNTDEQFLSPFSYSANVKIQLDRANLRPLWRCAGKRHLTTHLPMA